ncbi:MAG: (Fe-S)-binding protein [Ginsengibacter sp.]
MHLAQQIAFLVLLFSAIYLFARQVKKISRNINLGRAKDLSDQPGKRWNNLFLLALGQKKMFKKPLIGLMHLIIYAGFIIINIEVLEIVLDGVFGTHRLFAPYLGNFYSFLINFFEILAVGVIAVCIGFLARRNVFNIRRFRQHELDGWPRSDANYILITEIFLMSLFLTMNASDRALQLKSYPGYHEHLFYMSGVLSSSLSNFSPHSLLIIERSCWWLHIAGILAFLNYLPYSKHLHILLAFPNAYFKPLDPKGKMDNMKNVEQEVIYMFKPETIVEAPPAAEHPEFPHTQFGAKDVFDLSWKNLLDAYSCTECGRCTAACPANITGKVLSPRKIMMDTRDRMEEVGKNLDRHSGWQADNKTLLHDYITTEELRACTSCNACVEECPVSISPLDIILQLRRELVMEESNAPQEWNGMFSNIENNFAPWKFSPDERDQWATEMNNS